MSRKKPVSAIATELRKRFHERVTTVNKELVVDEKPSLRKWLLTMFLFLLIGLLLYYILGPQSIFQYPVSNTETGQN